MAKGYWISVYRTIHDPDTLAAYDKLAAPAVKAAGGRVLSLGTRLTAHEAATTHRVVLIEFDTYDQAITAYHSHAYQQALTTLADSAERDFRIIEATH
ncbi:DUF1330 domain-containing protein [Kitasatospora sp. NPDC058965]|uniref:DUF1330 domain-containing protein n=1 Tax=Kitasatospora sp. NPDC058965 TaxID=3346682 RepID=UPI0036ACDEB0